MKSSQKIALIVAAVAVFAVIAYQSTSARSSSSESMAAAGGQPAPADNTITPPAPVTDVAPQPTPAPADGSAGVVSAKTVTTIATYHVPSGDEKVGFTLTLDQSGVVTDATTEILGVAPITKSRQEAFAKALPETIKGKKLSELTHIDRVGGSSLTTAAFNQSLAALKAQI